MTKSSSAPPTNNERKRSARFRLAPWQVGIERHAMRLRSELGISDEQCLSHDLALRLIPKCEVWALKNVPNVPFEHVIHFRNMARQFGAFAYKDKDGDYRIVFNDSYPPEAVRVYLMEEFYHIRLGHPFDTVRLYAEEAKDHRTRTHSDAKEKEAYGCGAAALVPYGGLELMLARGDHVRRIAEHYFVPLDVVEHRLSVTGLSELISNPPRQLSLLHNPQPYSEAVITPMGNSAHVGFGHFLPGGQLLPAGIKGINETYRGWIEVDGTRQQAFVKFLRPWEIFNELLGSVLCQLIGLPTPLSFLVVVDRDEYPSPALFPDPQIQHALAFASQAMPAEALSRRMALTSLPALRALVEEWREWPDVILFDQWIANPDRHTGNVLSGAPGEVYLIDHGLCFYRQNWTPEEILASVSIVTTRLWTDFLQNVVSLQKRVDATPRIHAAASMQINVDIPAAMSATKTQNFVPAVNLVALVTFLESRRTSAPQIVSSAIGIPMLPFGEAK